MLTSYRVLDLAGDLGFLCGKILGDLGADVIKVEPPGGDPARRIGPYYHDEPDPEKSLYWFAYNNNKRGVTLDITAAAGRDLLLRLVKSADFMIETFQPGYLSSLGLSYEKLAAVNPRLIQVSISPYGQTGPYSGYLATDLEVMAMAGAMSLAGERDGAPMRVTVPQAPMWVGSEACMGALTALYQRAVTGVGQQVDVSAQVAVISSISHAPAFWDLNQVNPLREGVFLSGRSVTGARMRLFWPCKDGWVNFAIYGGVAGIRTNLALVEWMDGYGMAPAFMKEKNWRAFDATKVTQAEVDELEHHIGGFFKQLTKAEFLEGVTQREMLGYPVSAASDIVADDQLAAREFWQEVRHPELGVNIRYPGAFARFSQGDCQIRRRAPLIGEHNRAIFGDELGLAAAELANLAAAGVL